ncbi:MAG: M20/M25/M40 family metallo-hydrolase [Gemmatimonadota bacterium]
MLHRPSSRRFALALALALLGTSLLDAPLQGQAIGTAVEDPAATITAESMYNRLYFLASDALRGRDTPSPGLEAAAAYLVSEHRRAGLEPAGEDGTFYQRYPFRLVRPDVENVALELQGAGERAPVRVGANAFVRGGAPEALDGDMVFLGDVDQASPEPGSLEGRVAVVSLPGEWGNALFQLSNRQATHARESGARAVVHVLDGEFAAGAFAELGPQYGSASWFMGDRGLFPQVYLAGEAAALVIPELDALAARAARGEVFQEPAGARLEGSLPLDVLDDARPANVVAKLPGSDPVLSDEYVVLSAHYDHVGVRGPVEGDSIYNGADDNGSGTATLLEVARALALMEEAPRRSVVFVHVSGEEKGLRGAEWFVDHPTIDLDRAVANINADMVGGDAHPDTLVVIGKDYSTLGPLVDQVNEGMPELNLITSDDLWPEQRFFFRSDQFHFMRKEIPSLFFFTGIHECYHQPCDDVEFVDHDKASRVARLLLHSVLAIANADERPEWDPVGLEEVRELTGGGR